MKFAVIGGDRRAAILCALLLEDGHRVQCFGLEKAELPKAVQKAGCLQSAVYGADWVLLPVPAEKGGNILTPLSVQELSAQELLAVLWPGQVLCGGALGPDTSLGAVRAGLAVYDLMRRRDFTVSNAAVTAEGAAELLMKSSPKCLWGSHVLITGWGRIASILAPKLKALGAYVTVAARKTGDRAMAEAQGMGSCRFEELPLIVEDVDFVVNTVPAPVLDEGVLQLLRPGTVLLELASAPGGFDRAAAEAQGLTAVHAPGLPGAAAPYTAAELIRNTVYTIIREREDSHGE